MPCADPVSSYYLTAAVEIGAGAPSVRDALVGETGRHLSDGCTGFATYLGVSRVRVGNQAGIRFHERADAPSPDFQLWVRTGGVNATLLEPQVPVTVAGLTFTAYLGDPQVVMPAPVMGALGFAVFATLTAGAGVFVLKRRT